MKIFCNKPPSWASIPSSRASFVSESEPSLRFIWIPSVTSSVGGTSLFGGGTCAGMKARVSTCFEEPRKLVHT
ncbi:hypothetical protein DsansV1_C02g0015941 [Dioscorea sansibarensis]